MKNCYQQLLSDVINHYQTDVLNGLSYKEAKKRLASQGLNKTPKTITKSLVTIFIDQYKNYLSYILFGAAGVIFLSGAHSDAFIILGILLLNGVVGTVQEERITAIFRRMESFKKDDSIVMREGKKQVILDELLVEGDIVFLSEGNQVPADARIIDAYDFCVDESILTGESKPILKIAADIDQELPLYQQVNMVFAESVVASGIAKVLIVATGKRTERGMTYEIMDTLSAEVPLERDIEHILKVLLMIITGICFALLAIGLLTGKPFGQLLASITALFICIVPQGLPVIMTVVLVSGAYTVARKHIFVKKLQALETFGRTQVIIFDKTGTLTLNELMVTSCMAGEVEYKVTGSGYFKEGAVFVAKTEEKVIKPSDELLLMGHASLLLNGADISFNKQKGIYVVKGSSIEAALKVCAEKFGLDETVLTGFYKQHYEIPFHADTQFHAGFYEKDGKGIGLAVGSPEKLFEYGKHTVEQRNYFEKLVTSGLRAVAVIKTEYDIKAIPQDPEKQKEFFLNTLQQKTIVIGVFGITDSLRKESSSIIDQLHDAGIKVVMATGDHASTALYLAKSAHIADKEDELMEGDFLRSLSDNDLEKYLDKTTVFSRTVPTDKLRLVQMFQKQGFIVTMIGDGVNDAPALKAAHIGIAMGDTGSEITKQVSSIILLDNSFGNILMGIKEGRHSFLSFKRVILYYFTINFAELLVMAFMIAFAFPLPLIASQILWLNLITDGFLDYALALEKEEPHLLDKSWFSYNKSLLTKELIYRIFYQAIITTSAVLAVFFYYHSKHDIVLARTMAMATFTVCHAFTALNCRSLHLSLFSLSFFSNKWLAASFGAIIVIFLSILYLPFGQKLFNVVPLLPVHWALLAMIGIGLMCLEEVRKFLARRFLFFVDDSFKSE